MRGAAKEKRAGSRPARAAVLLLAVVAVGLLASPASASLPRLPAVGGITGDPLAAAPAATEPAWPPLHTEPPEPSPAPEPPRPRLRLFGSSSHGFGLFGRQRPGYDAGFLLETRLWAFELDSGELVGLERLQVLDGVGNLRLFTTDRRRGPRNRYYDPELGRFITADPMGYVDGPSMYQFGGYSPVNFGDPLGLQHDLQHPIWTAEQASAENTTAADIPDFPPGPVTKAYSEAAAAALDAENPASVRVVQGLTALVYAPFAGLEQIGRSLANTPHEVVESIGENFRCRALAVEVSEQKLSPEDSQTALESQDCATVMGPGIAQAPVGPGRLGRVGRNTSRAAREAAESLKLASGNLDEAAAAARTQRHGPIARIQFGRVQNQVDHAFRHTDQIGLARSDVQAAIRQDLSESANLLQEGLNVRTVRVGDVEVTYNAFRFSDDTINVGRITP